MHGSPPPRHEGAIQVPSLRLNFLWAFTGNLVYALGQWGMLIVLAKVGTPEMVGRFALGLAITAPIIVFSNLALRSVQSTDAKHEFHFGDYLDLRLLTTTGAFAIIVVISWGGNYLIESALTIITIGLAKSFEAISDVYYGLLQQQERMDTIAKSMMLKGPLSLALMGAGVLLTKSVLGGAIGLAVAWAIVLFGYDAPSGLRTLRNAGYPNKFTHPRWDKKALKKLTLLALPLALTMLLISLNANIPRFIIDRYLGERELGLFAAMAYLITAGSTVINALGQSASPRLSRYYAAGDMEAFRSLLRKLVGIGALVGGAGVAIAVIAGREVLTILYQAEYAKNVKTFVWLMIGAAVGYISSFLGYGMTAAHYYRIQPIIFAACAMLLVCLCLILIPEKGIIGAAWALAVSATCQMAASLAVNWHAINTQNRIKAAILRKNIY